MNTTENSSPGAAQDRGGGASAPAGRHRVRGWRPRTTRAKAGLAAVAAVGATGLALALVAGPAGATAKPAWIMTAGNVQSLSGVDASTASYFFNTPRPTAPGPAWSRPPSRPGTRPRRSWPTPPTPSSSRRHQQRRDHLPLQVGHVRPGELDRDPGQRAAGPGQVHDPVRPAGPRQRAEGRPGARPGPGSCHRLGPPPPAGESVNQWYLRVNIAGKAAAAGDIYLLQDESNTTLGGQYAYMFNTAQTQAQAANAGARVFSEVSTVNGTAAQMASAAQSISPDGYYVAAAGDIPETLSSSG